MRLVVVGVALVICFRSYHEIFAFVGVSDSLIEKSIIFLSSLMSAVGIWRCIALYLGRERLLTSRPDEFEGKREVSSEETRLLGDYLFVRVCALLFFLLADVLLVVLKNNDAVSFHYDEAVIFFLSLSVVVLLVDIACFSLVLNVLGVWPGEIYKTVADRFRRGMEKVVSSRIYAVVSAVAPMLVITTAAGRGVDRGAGSVSRKDEIRGLYWYCSADVFDGVDVKKRYLYHYERMRGRVQTYIKELNAKADLNLGIGVLTTIASLVIVGSLVFDKSVDVADFEKSKGVIFVRLSFAVFVEIFSFFFLRLYRSTLHDVKYFQNELTNVEMKLIALSVSSLSESPSLIKDIVKDLLRTERNFKLLKGETTIQLEAEKKEIDADISILRGLQRQYNRKK